MWAGKMLFALKYNKNDSRIFKSLSIVLHRRAATKYNMVMYHCIQCGIWVHFSVFEIILSDAFRSKSLKSTQAFKFCS